MPSAIMREYPSLREGTITPPLASIGVMCSADSLEPACPPRLATIKEACIYGKIGRTKLYEKLNANVLRAFTRDGRTLIDLDSIDEMNKALLKPWVPRARGENHLGAPKRRRL